MVYRYPAADDMASVPVLRLLVGQADSAAFVRAAPYTFTWTALTTLSCTVAVITGLPWPSFFAPVVLYSAPPVGLYFAGAYLIECVKHALHRELQLEAASRHRQLYPTTRRLPVADSSPSGGAESDLDASSAHINPEAVKLAHYITGPRRRREFLSPKDPADEQNVTLTWTTAVRAATNMLTAWARSFCHGCGGLLGWYEPITAVTRRRLYQVVLNTSLLAFVRSHSGIDPDVGVDVGGQVVLDEIDLPHCDGVRNLCTFRKIVIFVDHEAMMFRKVVCVKIDHYHLDGETETVARVTTWGHRNHPDNTDDVKITLAESLHQAGLILCVLALRLQTSSAHNQEADGFMAAQLHSNDNATSAFDDPPFPDASELTAPAATPSSRGPTFPKHRGRSIYPPFEFSTPRARSRSSSIAASEGAKKEPLLTVLQRRSTMYQITAAATTALQSLTEADGTPALSDVQVRAAIAATVQHSLERYMLGELGPVFTDHAQCIVLDTDWSERFFRRVYPVRHLLQPWLACRNRPTDKVATTIYNACVAREQELVQANKAGSKDAPLFVPLKNYCADYLQVPE